MTPRHLAFQRRFEWFLVPAKDVRTGDLMANNATVTASRKAREVEPRFGNAPADGRWFIGYGPHSATLCDPYRPCVVGRIPRPGDIGRAAKRRERIRRLRRRGAQGVAA